MAPLSPRKGGLRSSRDDDDDDDERRPHLITRINKNNKITHTHTRDEFETVYKY